MPFFLGSFIASFLFTSSLLVELSPSSPTHVDTKPQITQTTQTTVAEVSSIPTDKEPTLAEAAASSQVYGPFFSQNQMGQKYLSAGLRLRGSDSRSRQGLSPTVSKSPSVSITPTGIVLKPTETETPTPIKSGPTPTPAHTMFVSAVIVPSDTPSPSPTIMVANTTTTQITPPGTLNADLIFSLVNQHRTSMGLPAFEKDATTCSIAASRAPQIYDEIYVNNNMHAGLHKDNYPYWINENIISMDSEQAAVNWWLNDTIHREAIEGNYKYSCVACSGHSCSEIFTSYIPR